MYGGGSLVVGGLSSSREWTGYILPTGTLTSNGLDHYAPKRNSVSPDNPPLRPTNRSIVLARPGRWTR